MRIAGVVLALLIGAATMAPGAVLAAPAAKKGRQYYESRGEIVWDVATDRKVVALTFDDGPDPNDTPAILELLRRHGAKATFFVVGKRAEQYPELVRMEFEEGHEVANHSYSHSYFNRKSSEWIRGDMLKAEKTLLSITGTRPVLFRPPGGYYGDNVVRAASGADYRIVLWSWHQDTGDWDTPGVPHIVNKVLHNIRNGDIVLFHDFVYGETQTVKALQIILPRLREEGYRFVTVSELLTYGTTAPAAD